MADKNMSNGVAVDPDQDDEAAAEHAKKMEELEREKHELMSETADAKERVKLSMEIEGLKAEEAKLKEKVRELEEEVVRSQEAKKASEAIAKRTVELETEVSRLQHDLVSATSDAEDSSSEVNRLKEVLGENGKKTENLEREVELLNQAKVESETKEKELEKKIGVLEAMEKEKVGEKEKEIAALKKKVEDLEGLLAKKVAEIENLTAEKLNLEGEFKDWIEKERMVESRVNQLEEHVNSSASKLRSVETDLINGALNGNDSRIHDEAKGLNGLKSLWPLLAAGSTGAAAAAAAVYVCLGKRR